MSSLFQKKVLIPFFTLGVFVFGGLLYHFFSDDTPELFPVAHAMVSEEISQGADIVVTLPDYLSGVEKKDISFEPEIKGRWLESAESGKLIFHPEEELTMNQYYAVNIATENGDMREDFKIVESPEILTIFPQEGSETHENSDVTIVFNRPMVPLTTLDMLDTFAIPVEISPATEGEWKWIGTRTLQFRPTERLQRSSHYKVQVSSDFVSQDDLEVEGFESTFTTRPLRYLGMNSGTHLYNKPVRIRFNQPVDLEKTREFLKLYKWEKKTQETEESSEDNEENSDSAELPKEKKEESRRVEVGFILEYASDEEGNTDESTLFLYQKKDQHGREKFWDFTHHYEIVGEKAIPKEGDIHLENQFSSRITITDVVKSTSTHSERSYYSANDFFDSEGTYHIHFYEDIDLGNTEITSPKLKNIEYGEKCIDDGGSYYGNVECEKEEDKSELILTFDSEEVERNEELVVSLEKIVNIEGQQINFAPITKTITAIPEYKIIAVHPNGEESADLENMTICSTTPLVSPSKEDIGNYIKTEQEYEYGRWGNSWRVQPRNETSPCRVGHFHTNVVYRLMPNADYEMSVKAEDVFGDQQGVRINFTTGDMDRGDLDFYSLQNTYSITPPEKNILTFAVENMDSINMHICQLENEEMMKVLSDKPRYDTSPSVQKCSWEKQETIELPKKYWTKNYFQVNIQDYIERNLGHYVVTFSHPNYTNYRGVKIYERTYLTITQLGAVEKQVEMYSSARESSYNAPLSEGQKNTLKNLYWTTDLMTLDALSDATVDLYSRYNPSSPYSEEGRLEKIETLTTDDKGIAEMSARDDIYGAIIHKGESAAIISSGASANLKSGSNAYNQKRTFIYTDRPIYRPGDEVHVKGIHRVSYDGNFQVPEKKELTVSLRNSRYLGKGGEDSKFTKELTLNEFGTFSTSFMLDKEAPLGTYRIETEGGSFRFDVEEYVPAAFKVTATDTDKEEYISGDELELTVGAEYYFGAPLEGGTVSYSLTAQNYYFNKYTDEYFSFGSGWYRCYFDCSYGDTFLMRNKVEIQSDGKAVIRQKLDFENLFPDTEEQRSKIITIAMTVQNLNGESVTTQKSFVVHAGEFYLGVKSSDRFPRVNDDFTIKVKSVDIEGQETKVSDITLDIRKITWNYNKRKEVDGGYYYSWEKEYTSVETDDFSTDGDGDWDDEFSLEEPGEYEIRVSAQDERGNIVVSKGNVYVYGGRTYESDYEPGIVRPRNDTSLEVITDTPEIAPGDTARILIKNPFEKAKALISIERGDVYQYEVVEITESLFPYQFEVTEKYIPNVYASVTLISPEPSIKHGNVQFRVDPTEKELNVEVTSNKEKYLPGEEVQLEFTVTDSEENPVQTELSAAVVDMSVLALKGNPKKNPFVFFYNSLPLTVSTSSNLKNILQEIEIKKGKGGGGGEADATKKRGKFEDTAFWQAVITTDENGKASVTFTLPDNLTTWQVESIGVSRDTKVGVGYSEMMSRKEVMVVPLQPRFIIPGDEFSIGAKIFNQSDTAQKFSVSFESETLFSMDDAQLEATLKAGETRVIYFPVQAQTDLHYGVHTYILSAKNEQMEDTVEKTIPITRNDTYEAVATANYSSLGEQMEYIYLPDNVIPEKGNLQINASATLAVFLSDALNSLLRFPYGCSEQIASKLDAIAIVKRGLNLENIGNTFKVKGLEFDGEIYTLEEGVEKGLARLYENQKSDGGFGYYNNWYESNFYLTTRVARTLINLQQAGYQIDENRLDRALDFIANTVKNDRDYQGESSLIIASSVLSQGENLTEHSALITLIKEKVLGNDLLLQEQLDPTALARLAILMAENPDTFSESKKDEVYAALQNRIKIDARGAYLPSGATRRWQYYETTEKNTALLLKALVADNRDDGVTGRILRWLLRSQEKDGAWGSTSNTLTVIDGFVDYLIWTEEYESDYLLSISIDGEEKAVFDFNPETILNQESIEIAPLSELSFGELLPMTFKKTNRNEKKNTYYYDISLKYFLPVDTIPPRDEGFLIQRNFYRMNDYEMSTPITKAEVGDVLKGRITLIIPEDRHFVAVEDFLPAGVELVNFRLATEDKSILEEVEEYAPSANTSGESYGKGSSRSRTLYERDFRPNVEELRDDRVFLFDESVRAGVYHYEYFVRVLTPGKYHHLPAVVSEMYFPENFGRTRGEWFEVVEREE